MDEEEENDVQELTSIVPIGENPTPVEEPTNENKGMVRLIRDNIYYKKELKLKITKEIDEYNYWDLFDNDSEMKYGYSFINREEFNDIVDLNKVYQISVFVKNRLDIDSTLEAIKKLGSYDVVSVAYSKSNTEDLFSFIKRIFKYIATLAWVAVMAFLSYYLFYYILKSRMLYYAVIRMLGGTTSVIRTIARLEIVIYAISAFIVSELFLEYLKFLSDRYHFLNDEVLLNIHFPTHIICFIFLLIVAHRVSNKFNKKVFKDSMITTYSLEV